jgi:hypothetical protein
MNPNANSTEKASKLLKHLEKEINQHKRAARIKSVSTQILFWISILASGLAGVNLATKWFSVEGVSVLATIPAIVLIINNTFKYSAQARWHKLKEKKFLGLTHQLEFQEKSVADVSASFIDAEKELEDLRVEMELPKSK